MVAVVAELEVVAVAGQLEVAVTGDRLEVAVAGFGGFLGFALGLARLAGGDVEETESDWCYLSRSLLVCEQIAIGAHLLTAHRGQIKLIKKTERRRNVTFQVGDSITNRRGEKRRYTASDDEEPFDGFELSNEPPPARSELHPEALQEIVETKNASNYQPVGARKSTRKKKRAEHEDFLYY